MPRRSKASPFARALGRNWQALVRSNLRTGARLARSSSTSLLRPRKPPPGDGDWIAGVAVGAAGGRRYRLFRPSGLPPGVRPPLLVMLHGCGQDAAEFAASTRMNRLAQQHGFLVLYPEQDRLANSQGCWNWYETRGGGALGEVALILKSIDQCCLLYGADRERIAIAGLSAGASMAALVATRAPGRFKAVVMHSGIPPGTANSTATALSAMRGSRKTAPLDATAQKMASWPALLVIHGAGDRVVSGSNAQAAVRLWADAAQARPAPARMVRRGKRYPMTLTEFRRGAHAIATLVEIESLAHAWSGGAAAQPYGDAKGPDASRLAWSFVAREFRRPPRGVSTLARTG